MPQHWRTNSFRKRVMSKKCILQSISRVYADNKAKNFLIIQTSADNQSILTQLWTKWIDISTRAHFISLGSGHENGKKCIHTWNGFFNKAQATQMIDAAFEVIITDVVRWDPCRKQMSTSTITHCCITSTGTSDKRCPLILSNVSKLCFVDHGSA